MSVIWRLFCGWQRRTAQHENIRWQAGLDPWNGSEGNFGAKRAFDATYRLVVMGREGRPGEADVALSTLESEIKDLETVMQTALRETTSEGSDS